MATLKDVAKFAGVSIATASQALNGKSVNEKTRQRVLECADMLHYVPNKGGQSLITGKSNTILLVIINSAKHANLIRENTFFYSYIMGVLSEAQQHNYNFHLEVKNWEDPDLLDFFRVKCRDKSSDGMIILPQYIKNYDFLQYFEDFPYVILNPCLEDPKINYVSVEHSYGGYIVADLFIKKGYKNIGVIHGPDDHYDAECRRNGFINQLLKNNIIIPQSAQYYSDFTIKSGYTGTRKILLKHPEIEAIFCCNDFVAAGAMQYITESGLKIPDDIAIVGYDNIDIAKAITPALTTIDARLEEVGGVLARILFRQILDNESSIHSFIRPELIKRKSI